MSKPTRLNVGPIVPFKVAPTAAQKQEQTQQDVARKMGAKAADQFVNQQVEGQTFLADSLRECIGKSVPFLSGFRDRAIERYDEQVERLSKLRGGSIAAENHASVKGSLSSVYNRKSEVLASIKACLTLQKDGDASIKQAKALVAGQGYHSLVGFFRGINAQAAYGTVNMVKIAALREAASKKRLAEAGQLGARKDSVKRNIMFASVKELEQLAGLIEKRLVVARKNEAAAKHSRLASPKA